MILQLLNVVIGLSLIYLIFSTIASVLFDLIESLLKRRGILLSRGIKEILRKLSANPEADMRRFYEHPLISALFEGDFRENDRKLPSYIPPERFASVVQMLAEDATRAGPNDGDAFVKLVAFGRRLLAQGNSLAKELRTIESVLVEHFNDSMDRVSGWFARYTRGVLLLIGCVLAGAANVDTIQIVQTLSMDSVLADRVAESAGEYIEQRTAEVASSDDLSRQLEVLRDSRVLAESLGLPLGWRTGEVALLIGQPWPVAKKMIGILLTAFCLSFGATFWFDIVNRLVSLRTTIKPSGTKIRAESDDAADGAEDTPDARGTVAAAEVVVRGA